MDPDNGTTATLESILFRKARLPPRHTSLLTPFLSGGPPKEALFGLRHVNHSWHYGIICTCRLSRITKIFRVSAWYGVIRCMQFRSYTCYFVPVSTWTIMGISLSFAWHSGPSRRVIGCIPWAYYAIKSLFRMQITTGLKPWAWLSTREARFRFDDRQDSSLFSKVRAFYMFVDAASAPDFQYILGTLGL